MPTREQIGLPVNPGVMRTVAANADRCLGIYASLALPGLIAVGDEILVRIAAAPSRPVALARAGAVTLKRGLVRAVGALIPRVSDRRERGRRFAQHAGGSANTDPPGRSQSSAPCSSRVSHCPALTPVPGKAETQPSWLAAVHSQRMRPGVAASSRSKATAKPSTIVSWSGTSVVSQAMPTIT